MDQITRKCWPSLKKLVKDVHSSLFCRSFSDEEKKGLYHWSPARSQGGSLPDPRVRTQPGCKYQLIRRGARKLTGENLKVVWPNFQLKVWLFLL